MIRYTDCVGFTDTGLTKSQSIGLRVFFSPSCVKDVKHSVFLCDKRFMLKKKDMF